MDGRERMDLNSKNKELVSYGHKKLGDFQIESLLLVNCHLCPRNVGDTNIMLLMNK